ncbi:MAG: DUF2155 domain-containing protein [Thermohalobaculum sp.]|nr:DUF2155 domain-containing protein [Thermohalobaculum sp.]
MRIARMLVAVMLAGLAGLPGGVRAQTTPPAIEQSPLAPLRPRLPGGTVVTPGARLPLPEGVEVATPPAGSDAGIGAAAGDAAEGAKGTGAADEGAADGGAAEVAPQADPTGTAVPEASAGAATTGLPADGGAAEAPPVDLFKRAPPGTGGGPGAGAPQLIDQIERREAPGAVLRALDKLTGQIITFELAAGAETEVARLRVALSRCRVPVDGTSANNLAFLRIWDTRRSAEAPVFSGWMFADSPALSAMDHPRYDLWVIRCTTAEGSSSAAKP